MKKPLISIVVLVIALGAAWLLFGNNDNDEGSGETQTVEEKTVRPASRKSAAAETKPQPAPEETRPPQRDTAADKPGTTAEPLSMAAEIAALKGQNNQVIMGKMAELANKYAIDPATREAFMDAVVATNDDTLLSHAASSIVRTLKRHDPEKAMDFLDTDYPPLGDHEIKSERHMIAINWVEKKPKDLMNYMVKAKEEGKVGSRDMAFMIAQWVKKDEDAAIQWLEASDWKHADDNMVTQAGQRVEGERAALWFSQIHDDKKRHDNYLHLYTNWQKKDPEAASAWVNNLPAEDRAMVMELGAKKVAENKAIREKYAREAREKKEKYARKMEEWRKNRKSR
ncbi:hypothetical protein NT6N_21450 [Oceaniferula spumae]|uniref:HEAT repeat domain-containing protein n=1 Tax=Oceaniferula spumae TaxID=2979115 RepID=A0AAT9FM63_9BACT